MTDWLPGVTTARAYDRRWVARDLVAGVVLAAFLVPVGLGYAQAAGLPAINGLYATIVPLTVYAVLGPSRVLVLGPDSSLIPVIAAFVALLGATHSPERAVEIAATLAVVTGVLIALTGFLRFGFVTELLSRPARVGYLTGIALTIVVGQLPDLLGFSADGDDVIEGTRSLLEGIEDGATHVAALLVGVAAIVAIVVISRYWPRFPGVFVAMLGGIAAVTIFDLDVPIVGSLPSGLPSFSMPSMSLAEVPQYLGAAITIALIAVADTSVLSQSLATKRREEVDPDHELIAVGAADVATGFFQGFPVSASASRTPVALAAGAETQLTPLVGALAIAAMLLLAPGLLQDLPQSVLAAVVITAVVRLIDVEEIRRLWRMRRAEFVLWLAAFVAVLLLGVLIGVFVAIVLSLADFVRRAWRPHDAVLGRVDELKGYHDLERFPDARTIPGLLIFRFDAPLFFANAEHFRKEVRTRVSEAREPLRWIIVAAEPITDVDTTAAAMLSDLLDELEAAGITLAFAEMKDPVKDHLRRYGLFGRIGEDRFFPTLGTSVDGYVAAEDIRWVDWEERDSGDPSP